MARAGCKFIVHFSTLFSTTRNFVPKKNGTLLSCRLNHSQLCHLSGDFGECRFGGLLFVFPFNHTRMITRVRSDHWSIWINQVFGDDGSVKQASTAVAARAQMFGLLGRG